MISLISGQTKQFIKRAFPFTRYRWRIYALKHFIYHSSQETLCQKDFSQIINIPKFKLEIETVNESNRDTLTEFVVNNYNKNMYRNWISYFYKNNYNGFVASLNRNIIGYIWWWANDKSTKPPPEINFYNIKLKKDDVYMFNFFIAPQYRGKGNAIEFMSMVFSELKKIGYNRTTGIVGSNYLPARWTYRVVGYKDIRSVTKRNFFFSRISYLEKAIFIKNFAWHPYYPFEYHMIFSFRN